MLPMPWRVTFPSLRLRFLVVALSVGRRELQRGVLPRDPGSLPGVTVPLARPLAQVRAHPGGANAPQVVVGVLLAEVATRLVVPSGRPLHEVVPLVRLLVLRVSVRHVELRPIPLPLLSNKRFAS